MGKSLEMVYHWFLQAIKSSPVSYPNTISIWQYWNFLITDRINKALSFFYLKLLCSNTPKLSSFFHKLKGMTCLRLCNKTFPLWFPIWTDLYNFVKQGLLLPTKTHYYLSPRCGNVSDCIWFIHVLWTCAQFQTFWGKVLDAINTMGGLTFGVNPSIMFLGINIKM